MQNFGNVSSGGQIVGKEDYISAPFTTINHRANTILHSCFLSAVLE